MNDDHPLLGDPNEDERKTLAIMNLQAMLNIEDTDKVIQLLTQNNWDESDAASAYYAQQFQQEQRPGNNNGGAGAGARQNDLFDVGNDDGVRAPMQFQQEQLIPDGMGHAPMGDFNFAERYRQVRRQVMDGRFNYVSNIRGENEEAMEVDEGGVISKVWNAIWAIPKAVYYGLVWFKDLFLGQNDATAQLNGTEFSTAFKRKLIEMKLNEGFSVDFFQGTFNDLCHDARTEKKPILLISLKNTLEEPVLSSYSAFSGSCKYRDMRRSTSLPPIYEKKISRQIGVLSQGFGLQNSLTRQKDPEAPPSLKDWTYPQWPSNEDLAPTIYTLIIFYRCSEPRIYRTYTISFGPKGAPGSNQHTMNESFMVFGVYNDQLSNADGVHISQHLHLPEGSVLCIWSLFVHHNNTIQINSRLVGTTENTLHFFGKFIKYIRLHPCIFRTQ